MTRSYLFLCASLVLRADAWGFCADNDSSCGNWAKKGECEKDHVKKLCPHSCSVCTHTCRDSDPSCKQWGELGECEKNMMAMFKDCPVTCGVCKTKCYDKDVDCGGWARDGLCKKDPNLFTTCPVSCGTCTHLCLDKQNDCPQWASENQCIDNPAFMLKECPHSCMVCNEMTHKAAKHPVGIEAKTADGRTMAPRAACGDSDRKQCHIWGEHECGTNPSSVMKLCPEMCGVCTLACEDKYSDCPNWAQDPTSACDAKKDFMLPNCPQSCGVCASMHDFQDSSKDEV